ncbi:MAG TPA: FAD-dependent oxidoreductase, partial [Candidatus Saccharimonadales bacterium]|nr:FAD-dependent oxidoreductase [Candidatus Saccharimonadales bacterium]
RPCSGRQLSFIPGQFLSLQLPGDNKMLTRPYSIASSPEDGGPLEICLNLVPGGQGSQYLFTLVAGDMVNFSGPWGTFTLKEPPQAECIFLADGVGIVPIRSMIRRALAHHSQFPVRLLYRADCEQHLLYREELESWARQHTRFVFEPRLDHLSNRADGVTDSFREEIEARYIKQDEDRSRYFYICGVGAQVTQLRDLLRGSGYQRRGVLYEKW